MNTSNIKENEPSIFQRLLGKKSSDRENLAALEQLKMSQHRADSLMEAIGKAQAVIEFNMDGSIITANDNFLDTLGYTLDEITGNHHSMFVESGYKDSTEYKQFWENLNRGEFQAGEYKRLGKGGKEVWIQASYNPIVDANGAPFKIVKFATDTTAEVAALKAREAQTEKDAMVAAENSRIRSALDNVTSNVMMADADLNIIYMNNSVRDMMKDVEPSLKQVLPSFDADSLMGTNIDSFHKNPAHQRSLLSGLKSTYEGKIEVGGLTFTVVANPVFDDSGERLGTVVEWQNQTVEVAVENEISEIVSAAAAGDFSQRIEMEGKDGF